jgi:pyruvyl transferase EpsO
MSSIQETLKAQIEGALPAMIGDPNRICLIDPPGHANVGDSAILLGELDYLSRMNPDAKLSFYDINSFSDRAIAQINRADVLLIHGGGNFGDIWTHHHNVRMWVFKHFPHKKIIQLPQSIHFSDPAILAETAAAIAKLADFTLLTRDHRSFDFAKKTFEGQIHLMPDMAFAVEPMTRRPPSTDCFCLLRTDKEAVADHATILDVIRRTGRSVEAGDWLVERPTVAARADRLLGRVGRRAPELLAPFASRLLALRRRYAEERVAVGIDLLSRGRVVVADRLHAHIMCCLLSIPHVVFDSYDGKISALYETWTHKAPFARICRALADLPGLLDKVGNGAS